MLKKIGIFAVGTLLAVTLFSQPVLALDELAISCEGTRCAGGGAMTYQYTLINNSANPVTFTRFYLGTDDLTAGNYTNWVAPVGFTPTALVANWAVLGGMNCNVMGTTGVKTAHGVVPPLNTSSSNGGILWTAQPGITLNPAQTATFAFDHPNDYRDMEWLAEHPAPSPNISQSYIAQPIAGPTGVYTNGWIHGPSDQPAEGQNDFGDAPEGQNAIAYPSMGVAGFFPTCITVVPNGWAQHGLGWAHFAYQTGTQPPWDAELDGNAGLCPGCFPTYDDDECFLDGDAGLMFPEPFTIDAALNVVTCPNSIGTSLGQTCATAQWGVDVDIWVVNNMPVDGWVNVLMDWDQNGQWQGSSTCPSGPAPEHVLVDFLVPMGYNGPLSALGPPPFIIGPNSSYVWSRFSVTESPVGADWDGSGSFEDGESEDYLLRVDPSSTIPTVSEWGMIIFFILLVVSALWVIRRRTGQESV